MSESARASEASTGVMNPDDGWVTDDALFTAVVFHAIQPGDLVKCSECAKAHTATGWRGDLLCIEKEAIAAQPMHSSWITAWKPKTAG